MSVALSVVFLGACTDLNEKIEDQFTKDFNPDNPGVGTRDNVNKATPEDGMAAAFGRLRNGTANHGNYFSFMSVSTDEMAVTHKGSDWFDGGIWIDMHRHEWQSTHPALNGFWNDAYGGINECNRLLGTAGFDASQKAQLRTLRAYFYWRLMDAFGRVKVVTTSGQDAPQVNRIDVFNFIESELLAVVNDLPDGKADYGRVSNMSAYALLSRLYLNAEVYTGTARWQDAIDASDMVLNSGNYALSTNYGDVFSPRNIEDVEQIWVVPFDEATAGGMNFAQMTLNYPNQLTYDLQAQPWNGYSALEAFYNSYADGDARKDNNFLEGPQFDRDGNPLLDVAFDSADPDGAPINYTPFINELTPNASRQGGVRLQKYGFKMGQRPDMDNDYVLFRLGGIMLNRAEATARLAGNWNDPVAKNLVNQVRSRANVSEIGTLTEDEFLAERGREMFMESLRRVDLVRFGQWGAAWWEKAAHNNVNLSVFPIPNEQILAAAASTFQLTQNAGY